MDDQPKDSTEKFEKALTDLKLGKYLLRLYVAGNTEKSARAIESIHEICETYLKGRYQLEVIDIYRQPTLVRRDQIVAVPTLIKQLPAPLRLLVGDLSRKEQVLEGLGLVAVTS